jgi:hypothetical protein
MVNGKANTLILGGRRRLDRGIEDENESENEEEETLRL